ncbi:MULTISPECIES: hypothetical protein [Streptomyces]|uniref:Thiopeptide-type bacteriocin biosynthesis domain-containing protein n=1 Tax=Streptomyces eurythermus TaxID=42237 RepID=A0ABW6Z9B7_9ACTN|nr:MULTISPECIES: hypothetical protein [Streptomyces]QIS68682.1 hypothetical protein HB370_00335 [Streptomyces sp. DSM 40868]
MTNELSCYTANLAAYLADDHHDVRAHIARSVQLAVRVDTARPEFSHHGRSLALLPDGMSLGYRSSGDSREALDAVETELRRHGRVLVVGTSSHWILLDGRETGRWHVVDLFAALLPSGEKRPFTGWITDDALITAMRTPADPTPAQLLRDAYVFGDRVETPPHTHLRWLTRQRTREATMPGEWVTGTAALAHLRDWFTIGSAEAAANHEDVWAAARHQDYRLRWLAATGQTAVDDAGAAAEAWWQLVRSLRFAVESFKRGRPRPSLVDNSFAVVIKLLTPLQEAS